MQILHVDIQHVPVLCGMQLEGFLHIILLDMIQVRLENPHKGEKKTFHWSEMGHKVSIVKFCLLAQEQIFHQFRFNIQSTRMS